MARTATKSPFQEMEEEAYHAFREWPIFLIQRQKELEAHLAALAPPQAPAGLEESEMDAPEGARDEADAP